MCGIIGYTGPNHAFPILLAGLKQLEYRGYDSAGIAIRSTDDPVEIYKKTGKVSSLEEFCKDLSPAGTCGIGHTRWATHGGVSENNAHPHRHGAITLIHNGIIENYRELQKQYKPEGLCSETDTEIAAAVLDHFYRKTKNPYAAIHEAVTQMTGSFGFCILFDDIADTIFCIRNVSPLVVTCTDDGSYVASDLTALLPYSDRYFVVPEHHIAALTPKKLHIQGPNGNQITPDWQPITWSADAAQKNGFRHYMLKEIYEEPTALLNTIRPRITDNLPDFAADGISDDLFHGCDRIQIIACGTALHAGMVARSMMEPMLNIPVTVHIASEFRYEEPLMDKNTLAIIISQSGETIDTLEALRLARRHHARTLAVVNVKESTIARECDHVLYTHAGPEIAVASSKAYIVQLAALYLIACKMGLIHKKITSSEARLFMDHLNHTADAIKEVLSHAPQLASLAAGSLLTSSHAFYIGRGLDYALSLEGALKIKEISYIHAEAYAAGELKHGTIALITEGVPVIALATQRHVVSKMVSNIREVKARGAHVILLSRSADAKDATLFDIHVTLPDMDDRFMVFPAATALQLLAYYSADARGLDVDKPRNLAKSVTVE